MDKLSLILLAITSVASLRAPAYCQEVGSRAAYNHFRDTNRRLHLEKQYWNEAKKICILTLDQFADAPKSTISLGKAAASTVGRIEDQSLVVFEIIDDTTLLLELRSRDDYRYFLAKNCPTKGLADDDIVRLVGFIECTGPVEYDGDTIQSLRMLPADQQHKQLAKMKQETAEKAMAEIRSEFPVWQLEDGSQVAGKFLRYGGGFVLLEDHDGAQTKTKLSAFAGADGDKIREMIKASRKR